MANPSTIPVGLCQCGCGQRTALASQTRGDRGQVKGQPVAFVSGAHGRRAAARVVADRFWEKVQRADGDACWTWTANTNKDGYGFLKVGNRNVGAHRVAWALTNGPVPTGLDVLHRCDNPPCVRPDHLFVGTAKENSQDMLAKGRKNAAAGVRNGRSKLVPFEVEQIRASLESNTALANRFGVSWTTISHIRKGKIWKRGAA